MAKTSIYKSPVSDIILHVKACLTCVQLCETQELGSEAWNKTKANPPQARHWQSW